MRDTQDPSRVQEESLPSEELLQEAIKVANTVTGLSPDAGDLPLAREALRALYPSRENLWGLIINGYIAIARRGGRP